MPNKLKNKYDIRDWNIVKFRNQEAANRNYA
jgi:hypothetical protein